MTPDDGAALRERPKEADLSVRSADVRGRYQYRAGTDADECTGVLLLYSPQSLDPTRHTPCQPTMYL